MHVVGVLSHWLESRGLIEHKARHTALVRVVAAALKGAKLSLTQLGRARTGDTFEKHHIKAVDRLLGNHRLHLERAGVYAAIARSVLHRVKRPVIVVDWSDFEPGRKFALLKAAIPIGGRAITLYERVFPFARYNSPSAHREFLVALQAIVPKRCKPIIVTDAGFRGPWFHAVQQLGWDFVGRIRNGIKYFNVATGRWCLTDSLYKLATAKTQHLGQVLMSKRYGYRFRLYLVRAYAPRVGRPKRRRSDRSHGLYRRLHRAPWLLVTSLPHERGSERRIKQLYAQRMQIEETFRDIKSHRWGLGLRYCRCNDAERLQVLLLVSALATLMVWLTGLCAHALNWTRRFQANTVRSRAVLSTTFLGRQLILRAPTSLPSPAFATAWRELKRLVARAQFA
jgi:DDE family transposase